MIRILEKDVADKIAAGEVVDKPISIVKELMENSIDAGASLITVEIQKGGKSYIRVTDNGCGIEPDQVEKAFLRHATSKISQAKDLEQIETLGFRGEALASIAAVSRCEIITKTKEEKAGVRLLIEGSTPAEKEITGCPDGTTIVVRDLFYNTPARKKFMRSDAAESSAVIEFVSQMALAYAHCRVRMISNGTMLFSTPGKGDRRQNILTVYSRQIGDDLISVHEAKGFLTLDGYISNPGKSRATRKHQIFFVNGRVVDSKVIQRGVSQAYADRLFDGRFPVAFLFLRVSPDTLDVNIHPNKKEVRFHDEAFVSDFIESALKKALQAKESIPEIKKQDLFKLQKQPVSETAPAKQTSLETASVQTVQTEKKPEEEQVDIKKLLSTIREDTVRRDPEVQESQTPYETFSRPEEKTPPPFDFDDLTLTGSIFGTYITAIDSTCFYLIDQHAAHERIYFEKLMQQFYGSEKHSQPILTPVLLHIDKSDFHSKTDWLTALRQMGFILEEFGPGTFRVIEIPIFMELAEAESFLRDFTDRLSDNVRSDNPAAIEKITMRACKSAVKAHDFLKDCEIRQLITDLKKCKNPFSCPHGRPTFIKLTQHEIEKMFKRI